MTVQNDCPAGNDSSSRDEEGLRGDEVSAFRWATGPEVAELADEAYAVRVLDGDHPTAVCHHDGLHLVY